MKIILIQGGLGNQLYEYTYYRYLKEKSPKEKIWGFYLKKWLHDHNGLEINRWFDVDLPPTNKFIYALSIVLYYTNSILNRLGVTPFFVNKKWEQDDDAFFQIGFWQDSKYIKEVGIPSLNTLELDQYNKDILTKIESTSSLAIHVRRGDYLTPINIEMFGNICTTEYYKKSLEYIKNKFDNPTFFVFSNDIEYAQELLASESNVVFVDKNKGAMSFFDMFLMSNCKGLILANSSFSAWGAYLNKRARCIIAPSKWVNKPPFPHVYADNWIKISV